MPFSNLSPSAEEFVNSYSLRLLSAVHHILTVKKTTIQPMMAVEPTLDDRFAVRLFEKEFYQLFPVDITSVVEVGALRNLEYAMIRMESILKE